MRSTPSSAESRNLAPRPDALISARRTLSALLVAALAIVLGACGGDDGAKPAPIEKGSRGAAPGAPEFGENVIRVPGLSATDVAAAAILAVYPPEEEDNPEGWVLFPVDDWRRAVNAAQFAGDPIQGGLLPIEPDYLPTAASDLVERIRPEGFPRGEGLQVLVLGDPGPEVITELQGLNLNLTVTRTEGAAELAAELVPFRGGWAKAYSDVILVVSAEARDYALPAAGWSAFSGDTIVFVEGGVVPDATTRLIAQREKLRTVKPTVYLVGPESVIPESVGEQLAPLAEQVRRIPGESPVELSVELARMRDDDTGLGWGLDHGPANLSFVNVGKWDDAVGAITLAGEGPRAAPLLLPDSKHLPKPVADYLRGLRNDEGNQGWVLGDRESVSSSLLAEIDELLAPTGAKEKKAKEKKAERKRKPKREEPAGAEEKEERPEKGKPPAAKQPPETGGVPSPPAGD